jgi:hypothetical protein
MSAPRRIMLPGKSLEWMERAGFHLDKTSANYIIMQYMNSYSGIKL